jgi:hypothetical protein
MPNSADTTCPFCGARFRPDSTACPSCDLPLLGPDGSHPPKRRPPFAAPRFDEDDDSAPFDGASLFDEAFPAEAGDPAGFERRVTPLATEYRSGRGEAMRCVVVAINQAEADMLEDMLRAEGIPCLVRVVGRQADFVGPSRRELLVPESALRAARDLLRIEQPEREDLPAPSWRFAVTVLGGLIAVALCVALILGLS